MFYTLDAAIVDASRAAYLATSIMVGNLNLRTFDNSNLDEVRSMSVHVLNTKLNKLKKTSAQAFFYWALTDELLSSNSKTCSKPIE